MKSSISDIKEELEKICKELIIIQTESKQYRTPAEYGNERLSRWEARFKRYVTENISKEDASKLSNLNYSRSVIIYGHEPFKNFDNRINSFNSYIANLIMICKKILIIGIQSYKNPIQIMRGIIIYQL